MISDNNESNYIITLQDVDGITIGTTNYKINSGNKMSLEVNSFDVQLPTMVDIRQRNNRSLTETMNYTSLIAEHSFAGPANIKINLKGIIWADELERPRNSVGKPIDLIDLQNIRIFNHKLYLKDYQGNTTTVLTPINVLCVKADLLGNTAGTTTTGFPVVVTNISNIRRGVDSERGVFMTYNIDLEEER